MRWTNFSVKAFAGDKDPVSVMRERAQDTVLWAIDNGWEGPPFDPLHLAELLKIPIVPSADIPDARTIPAGQQSIRIEFNPTRPKGRVRFSIAHEIAHTFFEDCHEDIRHRHQASLKKDDSWQLEMLCNIGAAELLMPIGTLVEELAESIDIRRVLELRKEYGVSTEALFNRVATSSKEDCAAFCASGKVLSSGKPEYRIDYIIPSASWSGNVKSGFAVPKSSPVYDCRAIGFTSDGIESWGNPPVRVSVECVGLPSYPGATMPRVAGLIRRTTHKRKSTTAISYVVGNALEPRGRGRKIICQIVNDKTPNWGGGGFASAVRRKWPGVQANYKEWALSLPRKVLIGDHQVSKASEETSIFSIVAQKGYGPSSIPRIRYVGLETGLQHLADLALTRRASVHMPRIGVGQAGGHWAKIEELVKRELVRKGVAVTVYDLPENTRTQYSAHTALHLA